MQEERRTCDLGGDARGDGRPEALPGGGLQREEIRGSGVEAHEQVVGLVPQLEHPSSLGGDVGAGVQRAQSFVGDLETHRRTLLHVVIHHSAKNDADLHLLDFDQ